jgi:hypothetical protein
VEDDGGVAPELRPLAKSERHQGDDKIARNPHNDEGGIDGLLFDRAQNDPRGVESNHGKERTRTPNRLSRAMTAV